MSDGWDQGYVAPWNQPPEERNGLPSDEPIGPEDYDQSPAQDYEDEQMDSSYKPPTLSTCNCCREDFGSCDDGTLVKNTCLNSCLWCKDCLIRCLTVAAESESNYPPNCCFDGEIDIDITIHLLDDATRAKLDEVKELSETEDRTYCSNVACNVFLPPRMFMSSFATCTKCGLSTCCVCKKSQELHDIEHNECPEDEAERQMVQLAQESRWMACPMCKTYVERTDGCYHMTCLERHQFCYTCGKVWRTCGCLMNEADLYDANDNVYQGDGGNDYGAERDGGSDAFDNDQDYGYGDFEESYSAEYEGEYLEGSEPTSVIHRDQIPDQSTAIAEQASTKRPSRQPDPNCPHAELIRTEMSGRCHGPCRDFLPFFLWRCAACDGQWCNWCRRYDNDFRVKIQIKQNDDVDQDEEGTKEGEDKQGPEMELGLEQEQGHDEEQAHQSMNVTVQQEPNHEYRESKINHDNIQNYDDRDGDLYSADDSHTLPPHSSPLPTSSTTRADRRKLFRCQAQ